MNSPSSDDMFVPPARLPKASDLVVGWVRERILSGAWEPGTRLPNENELMSTFGVGRVSVREAIRLVERDGLVDVRRGAAGGVFVRRPAPNELSESFSIMLAVEGCTVREAVELRMMLEPEAAAAAARNVTDHPLRQHLEEESVAEDLGSLHGLHVRLAEISGNRGLHLVLAALEHVMSERLRPERLSDADLRGTSAAHRKIARRVLEGDADGARRAMQHHLEAYLDYLQDQEIADLPVIPPHSWKEPWTW